MSKSEGQCEQRGSRPPSHWPVGGLLHERIDEMNMASGVGVRVEFRGDLWTPELRTFASTAMQSAAGRFERRITGITVTLLDLNGPRGGIDKRCRVVLRLRRGRSVAVAATAENEHAAISEAS